MSAVIVFDAKLMEERNYWLKRLEGVAVARTMLDLDLSATTARPPSNGIPLSSADLDKRRLKGRLNYSFDATLTTNLRRLTGPSAFLLYTVLVSGVKVCLRRYTGTVAAPLGSPPLAECDHANALAIVDEVRDGESFRELLQRVRQGLLNAYAHQRYPYRRLLKDLGLANGEMGENEGGEKAALFDVSVALEGFHGKLTEAGEGLRLCFEEEFVERAEIVDRALSVRVEYDEQRYSHQLITRFIVHCEEILRAVMADTDRRIGELEMLRPEERQLLLEEWNQTGRPYPRDRSIHDLLAEQAAQTPERIALVCDGQWVSYRELNRRANQLGHYLQRLGVGPEALVGICVERGVEMVVAVIGSLKAGAAYLPLDPEYPPERLAFMLEDAGIRLALTLQELKDCLPGFCGQTVCLDVEWGRISQESDREPVSEVDEENLAYVIYTSGSTGKPKGVMVEHRGLSNLVEAQKEILGLGAGARVLQFASLSFDASVWEIFSSLAAGGRLYVHGRERLTPGDDLIRALREDQITTVTLPPTVLEMAGEKELINLETVVAAGEACSAEIAERWANERRFLDAYGPTEATVCASVGGCKAGGNSRLTIGRPIANTKLYILDPQMNPAPVGVRGELYIAGVGLARGYLGKPELTVERFIPNLFSREEGARLYRTGDVCRYLSDGNIEFHGRADEQVKIRGCRIEPAEIEAVLIEQPGVRQAVVVAREDAPGQKRLIAYVATDGVSSKAYEPNPFHKELFEGESFIEIKGHQAAKSLIADLRQAMGRRLPNYMMPSAIVLLDRMPLTGNGKLDRQALPAPEQGRSDNESSYEAPVGETETTLAQIWAEIFKLERVSRDDNFFELGGHSLLAITLSERMRQEGLRANVRSIFTHPTVADLATIVEKEWRL
jgi:amino acid adenylation domain-containing protein